MVARKIVPFTVSLMLMLLSACGYSSEMTAWVDVDSGLYLPEEEVFYFALRLDCYRERVGLKRYTSMKNKSVGEWLMIYRVPFGKRGKMPKSAPRRIATYEAEVPAFPGGEGSQGITKQFYIAAREEGDSRKDAGSTKGLVVYFEVLGEDFFPQRRYWKVPVASKKAASGRTSSTTDVLGPPSYERLIESGRIDTLALDGNASRKSIRFYTKIEYDSPAGSATTRRVALCDRETGQCEPFEEGEAWPPDCRGIKQTHAEY